jgi:alkanesulfonate monooxygenase
VQLDVFTTCPQSKEFVPSEFVPRLLEVARWSEEIGCRGSLVYTDNSLVDAWLVAQTLLENTKSLSPLVAVQPAYMHPYSAAKMVSSLGWLHSRQLCLNFVAGGFRNDLKALNDETPHDDRYLRMVEYATVMRRLLEADGPVSFHGKYYSIKNLRLTPRLSPDLFPGFYCSGSSPAGLEAAEAIGAVAVKYPKPPDEEAEGDTGAAASGIRVGIIARESAEEAWTVAYERFPEDRKGQVLHQLAMKVSDSEWHKQLAQRGAESAENSPYWLGPFQNYGTFCPYLVGDFGSVAAILSRYFEQGHRSLILDIPWSRENLLHTRTVLELAWKQAGI